MRGKRVSSEIRTLASEGRNIAKLSERMGRFWPHVRKAHIAPQACRAAAHSVAGFSKTNDFGQILVLLRATV